MAGQEHLPPGLARALAHVDARRQEFIDRLPAYVAQPSIGAQDISAQDIGAQCVGIQETARFLFAYLQRLGLETQLLNVASDPAGWPFVYARRSHAPTALLYANHDEANHDEANHDEANYDEANHAPNENLEVERFIAGIRTGAAVLAYLGEHA